MRLYAMQSPDIGPEQSPGHCAMRNVQFGGRGGEKEGEGEGEGEEELQRVLRSTSNMTTMQVDRQMYRREVT
jgi:hypothetical protein